jgi:endonuclease V-like protein UPF0215 family
VRGPFSRNIPEGDDLRRPILSLRLNCQRAGLRSRVFTVDDSVLQPRLINGAFCASGAQIRSGRVKVHAHNGAVTLDGCVKTEALKSTISYAAKHAPGVKSVVDNLEVKS